MLDVRLYRTAFLPALIAIFVVAFSLEGRPQPIRTRAVADAFDPARAYGSPAVRDSLLELGKAFPDRAPGSAGDDALAARVARSFKADGLSVSTSTATGRTLDGDRDLQTVTAIRPGLSTRRIVVIAHRDAHGAPALAELSGTAALLELGRIFRTRDPANEQTGATGRPQLVGRDLRKTLVLVSVSGGSEGAAGARTWAREAADGPVDAVLVLGDVASQAIAKPWVVPWSNGRTPAPLEWERTAEAALRAETGQDPGGARAAGQWARRSIPFTTTEQGEVNRAGLPAVLIQASGERGPAADAPTSRARMRQFGRGALRTVIALDEAGGRNGNRPVFTGSDGIVTLRNVVPAWSIRVLVLCLLLPALLAALDACFRARRRHLSVGSWLLWALAAGAAIPLAWAWLRLLGIAGALPAPRAPVDPGAIDLSAGQSIALASVVVPLGAGLFAARLLTRPGRRARAEPAAGAAGAAAGALLCAVAFLVWLWNPYASALLLIAAHLWLFLGAPRTRMRGAVGWLALLAGLVPLAFVAVYQLRALRTNPFELARMWLVAAAGGHVTPFAALMAGALAGSLALLVRVLRARAGADEPAAKAPRTRGPGNYAGPGSLGGTESALRR